MVGVAEGYSKSFLVLSLNLNIVSFVGKPDCLFQKGLVRLETVRTHFLVTVIVNVKVMKWYGILI